MKVNKKYRFYKSYIKRLICYFLLFLLCLTLIISFTDNKFLIAYIILCSMMFLCFLVYIFKLAKAFYLRKQKLCIGKIKDIHHSLFGISFTITYFNGEMELDFETNRIFFYFLFIQTYTFGVLKSTYIGKEITFYLDKNKAYVMDILK